MQTPGISIEDVSSSSPPPTNRPRSATPSSTENPEEPWHRPSIRIRRLTSSQSVNRPRSGSIENRSLGVEGRNVGSRPNSGTESQFLSVEGRSSPARSRSGSGSNRYLRHETRPLNVGGQQTARTRSSSDPPHMQRGGTPEGGAPRVGNRGSAYMPDVAEETTTTNLAPPPDLVLPAEDTGTTGNVRMARRLSNAASQTYSRFFPTLDTVPTAPVDPQEERYESELVDVLDTIDPEVSTLSTLTNVQNSLFVPDLGRYLNRRPTYTLTRHATRVSEVPNMESDQAAVEEDKPEENDLTAERRYTLTSITSKLDDTHFAVLPHGETLRGWSAEDRAELNDHVRHMMHSRKEKFKRSMKGFRQYVKKPLGFFVTVYATLITLFGLAWVLFLIGWINVGGRKDYIVNVIDNVLVALFAIIGDGLAPFRVVDTYHMCFIAHYHHLTWRLRRENSLPKLQNRNDLPPLPSEEPADVERAEEKTTKYSVLTPLQQKRLVHHQKKFSRSHTFYKPHETATHFAFPLRLLVAVVVLLDCHSLLQISLGTCTWAISYHVRPFALTTVILCCSITCNITAGVLISVGDKKTRKKDVLERMFRQDLTAQAMASLEKKKNKQREQNGLLEVPGAHGSTPQV